MFQTEGPHVNLTGAICPCACVLINIFVCKGHTAAFVLEILGLILQNFWGHAGARLVEALRYKPEGRGFDSHH